MRRRRRLLLWCFLAFIATVGVLVATRERWLPKVGMALQNSGSPGHADMALVLGGDHHGKRILLAGELAQKGFVPKVMVSGPSGVYGFYESELAIAFAVKHGYPESLFLPAPSDARSTREEAATLVPKLREIGVHKLMLVTSDFHSRRAGKIFRSAAPDMDISVVASDDTGYRLDRWWEEREGRKEVFFEWTKTFATMFGM